MPSLCAPFEVATTGTPIAKASKIFKRVAPHPTRRRCLPNNKQSMVLYHSRNRSVWYFSWMEEPFWHCHRELAYARDVVIGIIYEETIEQLHANAAQYPQLTFPKSSFREHACARLFRTVQLELDLQVATVLPYRNCRDRDPPEVQ